MFADIEAEVSLDCLKKELPEAHNHRDTPRAQSFFISDHWAFVGLAIRAHQLRCPLSERRAEAPLSLNELCVLVLMFREFAQRGPFDTRKLRG